MAKDLPMAQEDTPLRTSRPSFELAMARSRMRMPRDPDTGDLYAFMGLCAPYSAFELLGQGSGAHVKILANCSYLAILIAAFAIPLMYINNDPTRNLAEGSVGGWASLTWAHVVCDVMLVVLFGVFVSLIAAYLINPTSFEEHLVARKLRETEESVGKTAAAFESSLAKKGGENATLKHLGRTLGLASHISSSLEVMSDVSSMGEVLEASFLVEACSIVVTGWGRSHMPAALFEAIVDVAGETPRFAVQARACFALDEAREELRKATKCLDDALAVAELETVETATMAAKLDQRRLDRGVAERAVVEAEQASEAQPLDYAFLTFSSSEPKTRVLYAVVSGALPPAEFTVPSAIGSGHDNTTACGVVINPAPNPKDVRERDLNAPLELGALSRQIDSRFR